MTDPIVTNEDGDVSISDEQQYEYSYFPSTQEQYVISWLQIGPSILSLVGSYLIIYNIRRNSNSKSSPYRRIMMGLSVCNIISTIGWILEPFLTPANWVYAVGNHASCVAIGAITQFSITQHLFLAFLSVYFLMTVKFGVTQRDFQIKYEKWIFGFIIVFSLTTAMIGISFDYLRPNVIAPGCWINPPEGYHCDGWECAESKFAFFVGALPSICSLCIIIVSNIMLYQHVKRTVVEAQKKLRSAELKLKHFQVHVVLTSPTPKVPIDESISHTGSETNHEEEEEVVNMEDDNEEIDASKKYADPATVNENGSILSDVKEGTVLSSSSKQWKRVRQVGRQAFLYVGAYVVAFIWSFAVHHLNAINYERVPNSGNVLFPLMVLQAICGGSFGLSMALIYFVPKIKQTRLKYEYEPWWWVIEMAITGDAERVERFSSISNVSSIKSERSINSNTAARNNAASRPYKKSLLTRGGQIDGMTGMTSTTRGPVKRVSWTGEATTDIIGSPPLSGSSRSGGVPKNISLSKEFQKQLVLDSTDKTFPRLPISSDDVIDEEEEEGEEPHHHHHPQGHDDEEYDTTETDLEQSGEQELFTNIE